MSQSAGRSLAFKTAAGTEKHVYAGSTTSVLDDKDFKAISVSVIAAVPDDTRKTCRTRKCRRISSSSACTERSGEHAPMIPFHKSLQLRGAAAGGMVRPILIR